MKKKFFRLFNIQYTVVTLKRKTKILDAYEINTIKFNKNKKKILYISKQIRNKSLS